MSKRSVDPAVIGLSALLQTEEMADDVTRTDRMVVHDEVIRLGDEFARVVPTTLGGVHAKLSRMVFELRAIEGMEDDWQGRQDALSKVLWAQDRLMSRNGPAAVLEPLAAVLGELSEFQGEDHHDTILLTTTLEGIKTFL